jgi:hypothetical protein
METKLGELVPSEQNVLHELSKWIYSLSTAFKKEWEVENGSYIFSNLNRGWACIFIADYGHGDLAGYADL